MQLPGVSFVLSIRLDIGTATPPQRRTRPLLSARFFASPADSIPRWCGSPLLHRFVPSTRCRPHRHRDHAQNTGHISGENPDPAGFPRVAGGPRASLCSGLGVSTNPDSTVAIAEAVRDARAKFPADVVPMVAIVSATADRDLSEVARLFHEELHGVPSIGGTSNVSVLTSNGPIANGVSALLLATPHGAFATSCEPISGDGAEAAYEAGLQAATKLHRGASASSTFKDVKAIYMISSPGNEEHILRALHDVFGPNVVVVGGSAADNSISGDWAVFHSGTAYNHGVALFAVSGFVKVGAAMVSPYKETQYSALITETRGRTVLTLDGKPAADVIFSFVGDSILDQYKNGGLIIGQTSTKPISFRRTNSDGSVHLLTAHAAIINQPEGSVTFFAEAKVGDKLIFMENENNLSPTAAAGLAIRSAYDKARENGGLDDPSCCLLVYCGGLSIAVGDGLESNLKDDFASVAPRSAVGVAAFGEQGPLRASSGNSVRNEHCNLSVSMLLME